MNLFKIRGFSNKIAVIFSYRKIILFLSFENYSINNMFLSKYYDRFNTVIIAWFKYGFQSSLDEPNVNEMTRSTLFQFNTATYIQMYSKKINSDQRRWKKNIQSIRHHAVFFCERILIMCDDDGKGKPKTEKDEEIYFSRNLCFCEQTHKIQMKQWPSVWINSHWSPFVLKYIRLFNV